MAIQLLTGFESGDALELIGGSLQGTASIQSTTKRTGNYALRCNPTTTASGYASLFGVFGYSGGSWIYERFWFRVDTLPASGYEPIAMIVGGNFNLMIEIKSTGVLRGVDFSATADGTTVLSTGTWYRIELSVSIAGWAVKINGTAELGNGNSVGSLAEMRIGKSSNVSGQTVDFYYDDICVRDDQYPGDGQVELLLPNAAGNYAQCTNQASGTAVFGNINDVPNDGDTSYLTCTSSNQISTFGFTDPSAAISSVQALGWKVIEKAPIGSATFAPVFRQSSTDSTGSTITTSNSSYAAKAVYYLTNPVTSSAWTSGDITGVESGVKCTNSTTPPRISSLYLMIDYVPSSSHTYNETGSGGAVGGGTADVFAIYTFTPTGEATADGTAGGQAYDETTTGGAVAGGTADPSGHQLIWVSDANGVSLPFEIVNYDPVSGIMYLVFKADVLAAVDNTYYVYYGWER